MPPVAPVSRTDEPSEFHGAALLHARRRRGAAPRDTVAPVLAILALFGPTGVGKTDVAHRGRRAPAGARRAPVAVSADALQVYAAWRSSPARPTRATQARWSTGWCRSSTSTETFSRRRVRAARPRRDRRDPRRRRDADRRRRHRPLPARRAGRAGPRARRRAPGVRERADGRAGDAGRRGAARRLADRAPAVAQAIDPGDRHRIVRALELDAQGALDARAARRRASSGPPTPAARRAWSR